MSISTILQQTLDLIGEDERTIKSSTADQKAKSSAVPNFLTSYEIIQPLTPCIASASSETKTASSILLEERRKMKRKVDEIEKTDFRAMLESTKKKSTDIKSPFLEQIASSEVISVPKYKQLQNTPFENKSWAQSANNHKSTSNLLTGQSKTNLQAKGQTNTDKGRDYQSRLQQKMNKNISKTKLKNKAKMS